MRPLPSDELENRAAAKGESLPHNCFRESGGGESVVGESVAWLQPVDHVSPETAIDNRVSRNRRARDCAIDFFRHHQIGDRYWFEAAQSAIQRTVNVSLIFCEVGDLEIVDAKLKR